MVIREMTALTIAALAAGCSLGPAPTTSTEVSSKVPPRASKPTSGNLRGRVVDKDGAGLGGATVSTGELVGKSANPSESAVAAEVDNGRAMTVKHDFGDGQGEVPAERRPLAWPSKTEKYVYLRVGDFFMEALPPGSYSVRASFQDAKSEPQDVTVVKDKTTEDVTLSITFTP